MTDTLETAVHALPDGTPVADAGAAARKRARAVVNEALLAAGTPIDNRNLRRRILPGLWNAAINILIEYCEREEALSLLHDRASGIVGTGDNADAEPRAMSGKGLSSYRDEVSKAGETVLEALVPAFEKLEEEEIDEWFPETVLDSVLLVLVKAWGPDHLRRAIGEQAALFVRGIMQPHIFMEPSRLMKPPLRDDHAAPAVAPHLPAHEPLPQVPPLPERRLPANVRIDAYVHADISESGNGAWAVHLSLMGENREEDRYIFGVRKDPAGRATWAEALSECVTAICGEAERAQARVEMGSMEMVRAAEGIPGTRLPGEEAVWQAVDHAAARHDIAFRHREHALDNTVAERCDRKLRTLLAEAATRT